MVLSVASSKRVFNKLCAPAQFYLVVSLLSLVLYTLQMIQSNKTNTVVGLTIQTGVVIVWTYLLNWVCSLKHGNKVAWFLVFLPVLVLITLMVLLYHMVDTMGLSKGELQQMINQNSGVTYNEEGDLIEHGCSTC